MRTLLAQIGSTEGNTSLTHARWRVEDLLQKTEELARKFDPRLAVEIFYRRHDLDLLRGLTPLAKERVKLREGKRESQRKTQLKVKALIEHRRMLVEEFWKDEKRLHPHDLVDTRCQHVIARLRNAGLKRGFSNETLERDLRTLRRAGRIT